MNKLPTYLGKIISVSGASIFVELTPQVVSGLLVIEGKTHRIGQVGSFVRIPQGYNNLFGIISETSENSVDTNNSNKFISNRQIKIELVGEAIGCDFERGISQFPSISEEVHLVTEQDLKNIYGSENEGQIIIGKLSSSDSINVSIDLDNLVNKHSAVLGSTGSGKSTSVASLLRAIVTSHTQDILMPSARIVLFDLHGEYSSALGDIADVFSINAEPGTENLYIPYWCVSPESLIDFLCNPSADLKSKFMDFIVDEKIAFANKNKGLNLDTNKITPYTPIPFSLNKIWYDLYHFDSVNWNEKEMETPAYTADGEGDANKLIAPRFRPASTSNDNFVKKGGDNKWKKSLDNMRSKLFDSQYSFFLTPGGWTPNIEYEIKSDLPKLIQNWIGNNKPITILDLSGMPSERLDLLLGSMLDILFEAAIWSKNLDEGMKTNPLLLVMEEAHRYLSSDSSGLSKSMVRRIAKEGRKFGVGSMLISQRPSEIDETILSQCGTLFSLRISNATDRARVKSAMSDSLSGIVDSLPILRTGEAIVTGEAAKLPMRFKFRIPQEGQFPNSHDPKVSKNWSKDRLDHDFKDLVASWRQQGLTEVN
ncbi:ATP-binding protein [Shewanella sp. SR44-3]|uniref:ATP-binding protein n=1 Tax=Shewanella sp. SR44-3 TaxID=2760936 RepID=UPI0015FADA59|nr:ATP-binding protein [Shewanella sp. SR44-3]MBB1268635.1 ATP-binding protein [Shewanella sp. SR44-3]